MITEPARSLEDYDPVIRLTFDSYYLYLDSTYLRSKPPSMAVKIINYTTYTVHSWVKVKLILCTTVVKYQGTYCKIYTSLTLST